MSIGAWHISNSHQGESKEGDTIRVGKKTFLPDRAKKRKAIRVDAAGVPRAACGAAGTSAKGRGVLWRDARHLNRRFTPRRIRRVVSWCRGSRRYRRHKRVLSTRMVCPCQTSPPHFINQCCYPRAGPSHTLAACFVQTPSDYLLFCLKAVPSLVGGGGG